MTVQILQWTAAVYLTAGLVAGLGLALEKADALLVIETASSNYLERNRPTRILLLRLVDRTHSTGR